MNEIYKTRSSPEAPNRDRAADRKRIKQQTKEYLKGGGKIKKVKGAGDITIPEIREELEDGSKAKNYYMRSL